MRKPTIGVDISKDHLDACRWPDGETCRFSQRRKGHRRLLRWIGAEVARVAFEATGAYHAAFERALHRADVPCSKLNPARVRRFAEAIGTQAKTDRVDARLIARMGAMLEPGPQAPTPAILAELHELQPRPHRAAVRERTAARTAPAGSRSPSCGASTRTRLRQIERGARRDRRRNRRPRRLGPRPGAQGRDPLQHSGRLHGHRRGDPRRDARARHPRSRPRPRSLTGPAPFTRESGVEGQAKIGGGRARPPPGASTCQPSRPARFNPTSRPSTTGSAPRESPPRSPSSPSCESSSSSPTSSSATTAHGPPRSPHDPGRITETR